MSHVDVPNADPAILKSNLWQVLKNSRFGQIVGSVQDARVTRIEVNEKTRIGGAIAVAVLNRFFFDFTLG